MSVSDSVFSYFADSKPQADNGNAVLCRIHLTACAGTILDLDGHRLLIDALHNTDHSRWSALTPDMTETVFELLQREPPEVILCTHTHPDHYSSELLYRAIDTFPEAVPVQPYLLKKNNVSRRISDELNVRWFCLPHMRTDAPFDPPNFGFLIEYKGRQIFTPADADFSTQEIRSLISGLSPDLALLNFPWITLKAGRESLDLLAPKHLTLVHLPFADKDALDYIPSTLHAVDRFRSDAAVLYSFLQEVTFIL